MLILSYNVRGLGGAKLEAFYRILDFKRSKVVALLETMMEARKAQDTLKSYMRYWQMESLDADGHSGGW